MKPSWASTKPTYLEVKQKAVELLFAAAVIKILPARVQQGAHESYAKLVVSCIKLTRSLEIDAVGDDRVERAKYDCRLDHAVVVQLAEIFDHADAPLVELGHVALEA